MIGLSMKHLPWVDATWLVCLSQPRLDSHRDLSCHWSVYPVVIVRMGQGEEPCEFFPHWRTIGRAWMVTSRSCQLIGVRSRFEERSWTEEGEGRSPEPRGGTGPARIPRPDRSSVSFPETISLLSVSSEEEAAGTGRRRGGNDWELRCGCGFHNVPMLPDGTAWVEHGRTLTCFVRCGGCIQTPCKRAAGGSAHLWGAPLPFTRTVAHFTSSESSNVCSLRVVLRSQVRENGTDVATLQPNRAWEKAQIYHRTTALLLESAGWR